MDCTPVAALQSMIRENSEIDSHDGLENGNPHSEVRVHMTFRNTETGGVTNASSGPYVPRWKRDPSVKPEPYNKAITRQLKPGHYAAGQIAQAFGVDEIKHSFLVATKATAYESHGDAGARASTPHPDPGGPASSGEIIRCIFLYPESNPPTYEPGTHVIWTRNNVGAIRNSVGSVYPLFTSEVQAGNQIFSFGGNYKIESAEAATVDEVFEFVQWRKELKGGKFVRVWKDKLNSEWLKVKVRGCPEYEQKATPIGA